MGKHIVLWAALCLALYGYAAGAADEPGQAPKLDLRIGFVLNSAPTRLLFAVTNAGREEVRTDPLAVNDNRVVFITPGGKEIQHFFRVRPRPGAVGVVIGPSENKTWTLDLSKVLDLRNLTAPGWYGVYWSLEGVKSSTLWFYRPEPEEKNVGQPAAETTDAAAKKAAEGQAQPQPKPDQAPPPAE
jgi:hypothetical protein